MLSIQFMRTHLPGKTEENILTVSGENPEKCMGFPAESKSWNETIKKKRERKKKKKKEI